MDWYGKMYEDWSLSDVGCASDGAVNGLHNWANGIGLAGQDGERVGKLSGCHSSLGEDRKGGDSSDSRELHID